MAIKQCVGVWSQGRLRGENGYKKLARHFGWAFETIFGSNEEVQEVIVLEVMRGLVVLVVAGWVEWVTQIY